MSIRYWRFVHAEHGLICGPCAWTLGYHGQRSEAVEVTQPLLYRCQRCNEVMLPVASRSRDTVQAAL